MDQKICFVNGIFYKKVSSPSVKFQPFIYFVSAHNVTERGLYLRKLGDFSKRLIEGLVYPDDIPAAS